MEGGAPPPGLETEKVSVRHCDPKLPLRPAPEAPPLATPNRVDTAVTEEVEGPGKHSQIKN